MINISTIPEVCLQYTSVFMTARREHIIMLLIGIVIGFLATWLHDRVAR